jgi:hypothetical protein
MGRDCAAGSGDAGVHVRRVVIAVRGGRVCADERAGRKRQRDADQAIVRADGNLCAGGGGGNTGLAAYKLALPVATKWKSDAVLVEIQTAPPAPLSPDGSIKPMMWMVNFYSPSEGATNNVMVQGGKAILGNPAANKMTDDRSVPDPTSLMDSDKAVSIAEQNGGADARKQGATQAQVSLIHHALGDLRWIVN